MKIKIFQKGFNYSQDGPGNRLVISFAGLQHALWLVFQSRRLIN